MRWVPVAAVRPSRCALIPYVGAHHPRGYFDFGTDMPVMDGHVYVSVVAAEQMATTLGWSPPGDVAGLRAKAENLQAALDEVKGERDALRERFDAIDVLASEGFTARKKPGRKAVA